MPSRNIHKIVVCSVVLMWNIHTYKSTLHLYTTKPSNIAILLKIIKDNQNIDNISIIKNNKGYFK